MVTNETKDFTCYSIYKKENDKIREEKKYFHEKKDKLKTVFKRSFSVWNQEVSSIHFFKEFLEETAAFAAKNLVISFFLSRIVYHHEDSPKTFSSLFRSFLFFLLVFIPYIFIIGAWSNKIYFKWYKKDFHYFKELQHFDATVMALPTGIYIFNFSNVKY